MLFRSTLDNEQSVTQWISLLLGYTGCALWYDNGEWGITAETATYTAPFSVTEALMKDGEIDVQSRNVKNAPTVVRIWYTNTSAIPWREEYAEASMPGAGSTLPYLLSEVRMPGIQRYSHAYREAYEQLYDYQLGDLTASFVTRDQGLKIMPGDVFPITHSIGFSAKPFRCVSMPEPVDAGRWLVQTREFDPAKYSTAVVSGPTFTDTSLPSPGNPPTVGTVTLTEEVVTVPSGALPLSKIRATWAALSTWPFIAGYRVVVKTLAGVTVDSADVPAAEYISPPLNAATTYNVLVYARSSIAVSATASIASISLVSTGIGALASVWSQAISRADIGSWTFGDLVETYQLYPGDNTLRIRTKLPLPTLGMSRASRSAMTPFWKLIRGYGGHLIQLCSYMTMHPAVAEAVGYRPSRAAEAEFRVIVAAMRLLWRTLPEKARTDSMIYERLQLEQMELDGQTTGAAYCDRRARFEERRRRIIAYGERYKLDSFGVPESRGGCPVGR